MTISYGDIRIADYTYDLPPERIAKYPLPERDGSKLLVWDGSNISDHIFRELPALAEHDSLMVFNNTRVIRARLIFRNGCQEGCSHGRSPAGNRMMSERFTR